MPVPSPVWVSDFPSVSTTKVDFFSYTVPNVPWTPETPQKSIISSQKYKFSDCRSSFAGPCMDWGLTRPSQMMVRTVISYVLINSLKTLYMFINKAIVKESVPCFSFWCPVCWPYNMEALEQWTLASRVPHNITQPKLNCFMSKQWTWNAH